MYTIADDQWLVKLEGKKILASDILGHEVYICEDADESFISKFNESDASNSKLHCDLDTQSDPHALDLNLIGVLPNGLELKPLHLRLLRSSESLKSVIIDLTTELSKVRRKLCEAELELDRALAVNETMAAEKEKYQDAMLDKVCAILEERNVWIEKIKNLKQEGSNT